MAKAKTKKSGLGWLWQHKILSLVLLLAILIAGYLAYARVQAANNKRDFQQARTAIDSIYDDVIRNVKKPDNAELSSQCKKLHKEFSSGELICNTGDTLVYSLDSEEEANTLMKSVQKIVSLHGFRITREPASALHLNSTPSNIYDTAADTYKFKRLDCIVSYSYDPPNQKSILIKNKAMKAFEISIGCTGPASKQYYRLAS